MTGVDGSKFPVLGKIGTWIETSCMMQSASS